MKKSKKTILTISLLALILTLSNCNQCINAVSYIDNTKPLNFTSNFQGASEIAVNSDKFKRLTQWLSGNSCGWQPSPASYASTGVCVSQQNNFRLLYWKGTDEVVIGLIDKGNSSKQYSKRISKGELDFLAD
ncbi:MAG: hypothetical protein JWO03_1066 [Bacteroidetes bacterium]|nr:hypothetical protein [Bacteroidota bacterium]